jgi:hypothetical protein
MPEEYPILAKCRGKNGAFYFSKRDSGSKEIFVKPGMQLA